MIVNICGIPHKVIECEDNFNVDTHLGQIDYKVCEIRVNKDMAEEAKEEAKEIVEIFTTLNDSRDALGGICKDELMLYTVINGKPKCISGLLSDGQFREVERKVKSSLKANIDALTYELDSRKITSHMMMGGERE